MTLQQINAMKLALEALKDLQLCTDDYYDCSHEASKKGDEAITAIKEVLAEHAMRETQRLGQETEQEPVELCQYGQEPASCTSNPMHCQCAIDAALAQPEQEPVAYLCENAVGHRYFRWKKPSSTYKPIALYTTPPQRTERPVDCERCNRLEAQAYDLVGELRVANIKLSMRPQRPWVGLTDEEIWETISRIGTSDADVNPYAKLSDARAIEAKLKEKNCG